MPLGYERAAGGPGTSNPIGVRTGGAAQPDVDGAVRLPNLQPVARRPRAAAVHIAPVGFGPLPGAFPDRRRRLGRAGGRSDARLVEAPLPEDFDFGYFNAAPPDQQVPSLRDGERLILHNLHRDHPRLLTVLSGSRPRAFAERAGTAAGEVDSVAATPSGSTRTGRFARSPGAGRFRSRRGTRPAACWSRWRSRTRASSTRTCSPSQGGRRLPRLPVVRRYRLASVDCARARGGRPAHGGAPGRLRVGRARVPRDRAGRGLPAAGRGPALRARRRPREGRRRAPAARAREHDVADPGEAGAGRALPGSPRRGLPLPAPSPAAPRFGEPPPVTPGRRARAGAGRTTWEAPPPTSRARRSS